MLLRQIYSNKTTRTNFQFIADLYIMMLQIPIFRQTLSTRSECQRMGTSTATATIKARLRTGSLKELTSQTLRVKAQGIRTIRAIMGVHQVQ